MINFITLRILNFFDFFYYKKIFNFLKSLKLQNLDVVFDVGAHEGKCNFFLKILMLKKLYHSKQVKLIFQN